MLCLSLHFTFLKWKRSGSGRSESTKDRDVGSSDGYAIRRGETSKMLRKITLFGEATRVILLRKQSGQGSSTFWVCATPLDALQLIDDEDEMSEWSVWVEEERPVCLYLRARFSGTSVGGEQSIAGQGLSHIIETLRQHLHHHYAINLAIHTCLVACAAFADTVHLVLYIPSLMFANVGEQGILAGISW